MVLRAANPGPRRAAGLKYTAGMVRTEALSKSFFDPKKGEVRAVVDVSIEAHPGRIFGLLGVNGAGKTTLLRMLSTVLRPTSGRAEVAGVDVVADPGRVRASIGFLSTSTALYGRLSAREVLEYFGGLYGLQGEALRQRMELAIETLRLHEFLDRLCDKLSTGQKQRVSIARTILHDPPVLFFDEPTAGLDVMNSQTIMEFIEGARQNGKTVIFSTHIMSEAERLCDDVTVIHEGTIRGRGSVEQLKSQAGEISLEKAFLKLADYTPGGVSA